jgi:DNA mismatch repair protein MutS2
VVRSSCITANGSGSKIESGEEFSKAFPPGSKIYVPSLRRDGIIQSVPNAKGEITILSQSIRLNIHWKELRPAQQTNPTAKILRQMPYSFSGVIDVSETSIDLRGKTADEAIDLLEGFLDKSILHRNIRIKIIHGHGTDTLKRIVRSHLSRSVYVKTWQAGTPETGGDGVTWVELNL